jgi:hypothetical protein
LERGASLRSLWLLPALLKANTASLGGLVFIVIAPVLTNTQKCASQWEEPRR